MVSASIQRYQDAKAGSLSTNIDLNWIGVQFHIVKEDDGSGGLNQDIIPDILHELNEIFSHANIYFYLFDTVDYIFDSGYYSVDGSQEVNELKTINNIENVINIYTVESLSLDQNQLCGISSFTWFGIQGIVVKNDCFDKLTLAHEIGHFFDLFHTHEYTNGHEYVNGFNCSFRGDGLCDTPADPNLSLDGMMNQCEYIGTVTDLNGQRYDDCQGYDICQLYEGPDVNNIMSYSPNNCLHHFTNEQYDKIYHTLHSQRLAYIVYPNYINYSIEIYDFLDINGDNDLIINPGEIIDLIFRVKIDSLWPISAQNIILSLTSEESYVNIFNQQLELDSLNNGETFINSNEPFQIQFYNDAELRDYDFNLNIYYQMESGYFNEVDYPFTLNISNNQNGFPFNINSTIRNSPAIFDINDDGYKEVIFGSDNGSLYICDREMNILNEFNTNGQIWGSPAISDVDIDGDMEIIFSSTDGNIYMLNNIGEFQSSYDIGQILIGTPALGNLDADDELEIVFGGYSSVSKLFALNHDFSLVNSFPIQIDEKIKEGVALADLNNDSLDEIYFGTENGSLFKVDNSDLSLIYTASDKIIFAPVVINNEYDDLIGFGSDDGTFYSINSTGELVFSIQTGSKIRSSASVINYGENGYILFGSEDGSVYNVDFNGNSLAGWPVFIGEPINTTPVFVDIEHDGVPEVIVAGASIIKIIDFEGNILNQHNVTNDIIKGSLIIDDIDLDNDVEIIFGSNNALHGIDYKIQSNSENFWSMFRGNLLRTGYTNYSHLSTILKQDFTALDIINIYPNPFNSLTNVMLYVEKPTKYSFSIYDLNGALVFKKTVNYNSVGQKNFLFNFKDLSSGLYILQIKNNKKIKNSKLLFLK